MDGQYILVGQTPVPCEDLLEWARWMEAHNRRRVGLTRVGPVFVSTIFLGLDHRYFGKGPPVLFETMAWTEVQAPHAPPCECLDCRHPRAFLDIQERYRTWDDAEQGHRKIVMDLAAEHPGDEVEFLECTGAAPAIPEPR